MDASEINLLDKDRFAQGTPHEWFTWLRANAPIWRHPEPDGPGFWVLSKHSYITELGRNPQVFSSDDLYGGPTGLTVADRSRMNDAAKGARSLPHMDPPDHTQYRLIVERRFRNRPISELEDRIRELTSELLDATLKRGVCDVVHDVASVVPITIICEMLGLPTEDRDKVIAIAKADFGVDDPEILTDKDAYVAAREGTQSYAHKLMALRREKPGSDLMTVLVQSTVDGRPLTDQEIALYFELFIDAGHETVLTALSQTVQAFVENPDELRRLAAHPELATSATEEALRWATPVMYFRRAVTEDIDFHGYRFKEGESVTMWYISGNRDDDVFIDPFRFDIGRNPNHHLTFGGGGPHFCLGARLARLEIRVFLEELAKRVGVIEAAGDPAPLRSNLFNAYKRLPVRFVPSLVNS
ncbi:MAG TPA: cytochrome P450 [Acidimicrobiales bacterium]|nr:cytochrome P450 [Acidimicrobiales bacterium]